MENEIAAKQLGPEEQVHSSPQACCRLVYKNYSCYCKNLFILRLYHGMS